MTDLRLFPNLLTERLILRKLASKDLNALEVLANNIEITNRIINFPYPFRPHDASLRLAYINKGYLEGQRYIFAIVESKTGNFMGEIGLHYHDQRQNHFQLSYWLGQPFWRQGFMSEAIARMLDFGFNELCADLIYADCHSSNIASIMALLKNHFKLHSTHGNVNLYRYLKVDFIK